MSRLSAVISGSKLFNTQITFLPTVSDIEAFSKKKHTRKADDDLFSGLKLNPSVPLRAFRRYT